MAYHVISIGVSQYKYPHYRNLDFAHADAIAFDRLLSKNLPDIKFRKLLVDNEATLSEVLTTFNSEELKSADQNDVFFLFFSGHGAIAKDDSGEYATYLVPFDATKDIASSSISVNYLKDFFEKLPHSSKHMFIDCCYSGNASSKSVSSYKPKDGMKLKTIQDELTAAGTVVMTACAEDETAIEASQFEHGLFTYCLLDELIKPRSGDRFPVGDVYTPVAEQVQQTAKDTFHHKQTPTIKTHLRGAVYLPVFKEPVDFKPTVIVPSKYERLAELPFTPANIQLSDKQQEKMLNDLLAVVDAARGGSRSATISYKKLVGDSLDSVKRLWERHLETTGDIGKLPDAVVKVEAQSLQLMMLVAVVSLYGNDKLREILFDELVQIMSWEHGKAGFTAMIAVPEIVLVNAMYLIGVLSIAQRDLRPFMQLMNTYVIEAGRDNDPAKLKLFSRPHYCGALGGNAIKVSEHVREVLGSYAWLEELEPALRGKVLDYNLQANMLMALMAMKNGVPFYPYYGRFYPERVKSIVDRLKIGGTMLAQTAALLDLKPEVLRPELVKIHERIVAQPLGSMVFWDSISSQAFLTKKEREAAES